MTLLLSRRGALRRTATLFVLSLLATALLCMAPAWLPLPGQFDYPPREAAVDLVQEHTAYAFHPHFDLYVNDWSISPVADLNWSEIWYVELEANPLGEIVHIQQTSPDHREWAVVSSGWPLRCAQCTAVKEPDSGTYSWSNALLASRTTTRPELRDVAIAPIPLVNAWLPFVLNWLILMAVLAFGDCSVRVARLLVRRVKERRRTRHNLCVRCGYPIAAQGTACPECGASYS